LQEKTPGRKAVDVGFSAIDLFRETPWGDTKKTDHNGRLEAVIVHQPTNLF
jgi:hypothetical protein